MSDRELLELAAKAAGYTPFAWSKGMDCLSVRDESTGLEFGWNPLTNDGHALRLAVKLDIQIWRRPSGVEGIHKGSVLTQPQTEPLMPDPYAATRRAIVRAAAEIGKQCDKEGREG